MIDSRYLNGMFIISHKKRGFRRAVNALGLRKIYYPFHTDYKAETIIEWAWALVEAFLV
jgi:nitrate reductase beta subunit